MAHDDPARQAELDTLAALERELSPSTGGGCMRVSGPVVAGPPDDVLEFARLEIAAALGGYPTSGAMFQTFSPRRPRRPAPADSASASFRRRRPSAGAGRGGHAVGRSAAIMSSLQRAYRDDIAYYEERALGLLASATDATPSALAAFEASGASLTAAGARTVVAHAHGDPSWAQLRRHIAGLADDPFALAYRALEAHDVEGLRAQLSRAPAIVDARGTNGNDLLGIATATCDERLVALLLAAGSDVAGANVHGWTALHQAAYVGLPLLVRMLLDAGAPVHAEARGEGGTPLVVALFWGHAQTAELLCGHGVLPPNLRTAAGLGRADLVAELVGTDGTLAPRAGAARGFYRPHSGFPAWQPSDDPREILDESLAWAARNDQTEVLDLLVALGADLGADVYRGSALAWAAACGRVAAMQRLIALGADPDGRSSFGGPDHGVRATALHLAAGGGHLGAVRVLLAAGADPRLRDGCHDSTPAGWAEHMGCDDDLERLLRELE